MTRDETLLIHAGRLVTCDPERASESMRRHIESSGKPIVKLLQDETEEDS